MKYKKICLVIPLLISLLLSSCGNRAGEEVSKEKNKQAEHVIATTPSDIEMEMEMSLIKKNAVERSIFRYHLDKGNLYKSALNGKYYREEQLKARPISVIYDNHPSARWQAGITKADIVYECEVEYPYTRYMAVFQTGYPEHIGPIRSARSYFIRYASEYDSVYVHVGGSEEALALIRDNGIADID